jgi:sialate O-acetylesterase
LPVEAGHGQLQREFEEAARSGITSWGKNMNKSVSISKFAVLLSSVLLALTASAAQGEIRFAKIFSNDAVLQREVPIHVWGWTTPHASVSVHLHDQTVPAVADRIGRWDAWFAPEQAGGPFTLTAQGPSKDDTATVTDLLIGDVWLASGQSNMELPLGGWASVGAVIKNSEAEIKAADQPQIRLLLISSKSSDFPLDEVDSTWTKCTPSTAAQFSAVAYFFGKEIAKDQKVPVGLITAASGGTPADSWISMEGLSSDASMMLSFANRAKFQQQLAHRDSILAANQREVEEAKAAGKPVPLFEWIPNGPSWQPAGLYNGMIAPLTGYSLKGFLWYQGESDSGPERAPEYAKVFQILIQDWRDQFAQGDLPFLFAQISSFKWPDSWGEVRDAQRRALGLRSTAMAVTSDVGDPANIHPPDKQSVAARLALAARAMVYGEQVSYQSPLFRQATSMPGGMRVWFDHADGLHAHSASVEGFELAGDDHIFVPADASIAGETVVVTTTKIANPRYVRYAFAGVAPPALYNAADLPASSFTSEDVTDR